MTADPGPVLAADQMLQQSHRKQWPQKRTSTALCAAPESPRHAGRQLQGRSERVNDGAHRGARPQPAELPSPQGNSPAGIQRRVEGPGLGRDGHGRRRQRVEHQARPESEERRHASPALVVHFQPPEAAGDCPGFHEIQVSPILGETGSKPPTTNTPSQLISRLEPSGAHVQSRPVSPNQHWRGFLL